MPYDLFISYSRRDNESGQVAALASEIMTAFRTFAGREGSVFLDTHEIQGMDDWRQKIQRSLRESHLFLAVLSPSYLASRYCRWFRVHRRREQGPRAGFRAGPTGPQSRRALPDRGR